MRRIAIVTVTGRTVEIEEIDDQPEIAGAYDSAGLLFDAVERAGSWDHDAVSDALAATEGYEGITGDVTIDPETGHRTDVPVVILDITEDDKFVVDEEWADLAGFAN